MDGLFEWFLFTTYLGICPEFEVMSFRTSNRQSVDTDIYESTNSFKINPVSIKSVPDIEIPFSSSPCICSKTKSLTQTCTIFAVRPVSTVSCIVYFLVCRLIETYFPPLLYRILQSALSWIFTESEQVSINVLEFGTRTFQRQEWREK